MDPFEQLKQDLSAGRIDANAVLSFIVHLQQQLQVAYQRIAELEAKLGVSTPKD